MKPLSPLQRVHALEKEFPVFLKREDLLVPGGGNKVRRFQAFFEETGQVDKVATLSDPGAHTFHILKHFLLDGDSDEGIGGAKQLIFLERKTPLTPYRETIRESYRQLPNIKVSQASSFIQLLRFMLYKYASFGRVQTIGIGGHVKATPNPFERAMEECIEQLKQEHIEGNVVHLFPISSGNMADGFLSYVHKKGVAQHSFVGVTTGDRFSIPLLMRKYAKEKKINLIKPNRYSYQEYVSKATEFHQKTSVWLDPIHTIHLTDVLEDHSFPNDSTFPKDVTLVLWITCPYVKNLTP
jgi:hypothetical protein